MAFQVKGQVDIWWEGVLSARAPVLGPVTWEDFLGQFRAKFYPDSFLERMENSLLTFVQGKLSMADYEAGFNNLVLFVPAVAGNDREKAKWFQRGLNSEYRHVLGASSLLDFNSVVDQAKGVDLERELTKER